jgi:hypothetical protein
VERLGGQDVALSNARSAATALSQERADRIEVELFLEQLTQQPTADAWDQRLVDAESAPRSGVGR